MLLVICVLCRVLCHVLCPQILHCLAQFCTWEHDMLGGIIGGRTGGAPAPGPVGPPGPPGVSWTAKRSGLFRICPCC